MVDIKKLLPELRALVIDLAEDMLVRVKTEDTAKDAELRSEFEKIREAGRTAQGYEEWREDYLDQVAVAWVLGCIFVRFIEDNDLIDERYLAGLGDSRALAEGEYEIYFRNHPHHTDREYLKNAFSQIGKIPAARDLFAEGNTPLWMVDPSGDAARRLLRYFCEIDAEKGGLKRTFGTPRSTTQPLVDVYQGLAPQARFLGDLYQDLSEHARKKYALLQTPEFVEKFILDRTLNRAIEEFGLRMYVDDPKRTGGKKSVARLRIIDPTCGSGHFLLDAFERLVKEWNKPEYGVNNVIVAAQNALDSIFGVDINSFAIAITRFRLLVAAVQACGFRKLNQQTHSWKINLAVGDSLLRGSKPGFNNERDPILRQQEIEFEPDPRLALEDPKAANEILDQGFHVVVGNPPYITPKDKAQNEEYRRNYPKVCHRQYSLGVPFTQRFWDLAIRTGERVRGNSEEISSGPGYVGMITANSFMKREFGKKLIEEFFPRIDLTHVLDTSGAYIPGHGTPTVILFGRHSKPVGETVRAVLGIKGEPTTPGDPSQGLVWRSILANIDLVSGLDKFTSSADVLRTTFGVHPWSIGGGGATDLKERIDEGCETSMQGLNADIGFLVITGEDNCLVLEMDVPARKGIKRIMPLILGDDIRDWSLSMGLVCLWPYDPSGNRLSIHEIENHLQFCWPYRVVLRERKAFGIPVEQKGIPWWSLRELYLQRLRTPLSISFAFVATHNHFVLDRGGKVFKQSAPIIKLPAEATEDDHLALLGLLNSSTACFWLKQVMTDKGNGGIGGGIGDEHWERRFEFSGTQLQNIPIPDQRPLALTRLLDSLGQEFNASLPDAIVQRGIPTPAGLEEGQATADRIRGRMIALQEELDWECYRLYGLLPDDLRQTGDDLPELKLGERAFEIVMARQIDKGKLKTSWFERHGSTPIIEIPPHWPATYRLLVERRIRVIETNKEIGLIERPEYKRRWNTESWADQQERALKGWLLDRLESSRYWPGVDLQTTARLADRASGDLEFLQVAALYRGRPDFDVAALVRELVEGESVPFLPILRYKPSGLRKREVWERTWDLQRQQDAGKEVGDIPVPPKYATADFLKTDYWRLRGKLDVPKERWISYPHLQTEGDPSLVIGWAGWDHLQQAAALVAYYESRKREGWDGKRLAPILAGLDQLLPWIHQWHPEIDPEFGDTAGQSYQALLENDAHELGLTLEDIRNWQPPEKTRKARAVRSKKKDQAEDDE
jgi:hypothetical protein